MGELPWGLLLAAGYLLLQIPLVLAIARIVDRDEVENGTAGNAELPVSRAPLRGIDGADRGTVDGHSADDSVDGHSADDSVDGHSADDSVDGHSADDPVDGHSADDPDGVAACAQCGTVNDATYTFCRRCVRRLPAEEWDTDRERERGRGEERVR